MKQYQKVAEIRSSTNYDKFYTISKDDEGNLSCNCPSWIFKNRKGLLNGNRYCKHIKEYWDKILK